MLPMRFLFRSRWAALFWAGGICLTAYHQAKPDAAPETDASANALADAASAFSK